MTKNKWMLQLKFSYSAKLHRQRFNRAGQVAKSKLCFGEILIFQKLCHSKKGLWLNASLLALTEIRLKLGPGFQGVLLFIFFHWHHIPKRTDCLESVPHDGSSTMSVHLLLWLWCFHPCPLYSLIPVPRVQMVMSHCLVVSHYLETSL